MSKSLVTILGALSLLIAVIALGREAPLKKADVRAPTTARALTHARSAPHAAPRDRTTIDDDDEYDDDDEVEVAMLAPPQHDAKDSASDAQSDARAASTFDRVFLAGESQGLTTRGIRPSGEHRNATDRPPRS